MVDVLVRLNILINAKHVAYQKYQRKKNFLFISVTCRVAGIPSPGVKGHRSSSAMGLISKTLRSITVSSVLLFHCFINDNVCKRWSDIQFNNIKEPYSRFHFLLVGSLIACTLSLYRDPKLCIYKNIRNL